MTDCIGWFAGALLIIGVVGVRVCAIALNIFWLPFRRKD